MGTNQEKDVLLSVRPQYANLLVEGVKTVELRRRFPVDLVEGSRCLIYSTSPVQKVIGECKILSVQRLPVPELWEKCALEAMIPWEGFSSYFGGVDHGYAVRMYGHVRYEKEKNLEDVTGQNSKAPQSYRYVPRDPSPTV